MRSARAGHRSLGASYEAIAGTPLRPVLVPLTFASPLCFSTLINQSKGVHRMAIRGTGNGGYPDSVLAHDGSLIHGDSSLATASPPRRPSLSGLVSLHVLQERGHYSFYLIFQSLVSASFPRCWVSHGLNIGIWKYSSVLHSALQSVGQEGFLHIPNSSQNNKVIGSKWGGFPTV